jgi:hypothetical protein
MIDGVRRTHAMSVDDFNDLLAEFHASAEPGEVVGADDYGQAPWLWVKLMGNRYHLNADSTAEGVGRYLALLKQHGPRLTWTLVSNETGQVAFGPEKTVIPGFNFYRADM